MSMKYKYPAPLPNGDKQAYAQLDSDEESKKSESDRTLTEKDDTSSAEEEDLGQFTSNEEYLRASNPNRSVLSNYKEGSYHINSSSWKQVDSGKCALVEELLRDEVLPPVGLQHSAQSSSVRKWRAAEATLIIANTAPKTPPSSSDYDDEEDSAQSQQLNCRYTDTSNWLQVEPSRKELPGQSSYFADFEEPVSSSDEKQPSSRTITEHSSPRQQYAGFTIGSHGAIENNQWYSEAESGYASDFNRQKESSSQFEAPEIKQSKNKKKRNKNKKKKEEKKEQAATEEEPEKVEEAPVKRFEIIRPQTAPVFKTDNKQKGKINAPQSQQQSTSNLQKNQSQPAQQVKKEKEAKPKEIVPQMTKNQSASNLQFEKVGSNKRGKGDKKYDELSPPRALKVNSKAEVSPIKKAVSSQLDQNVSAKNRSSSAQGQQQLQYKAKPVEPVQYQPKKNKNEVAQQQQIFVPKQSKKIEKSKNSSNSQKTGPLSIGGSQSSRQLSPSSAFTGAGRGGAFIGGQNRQPQVIFDSSAKQQQTRSTSQTNQNTSESYPSKAKRANANKKKRKFQGSVGDEQQQIQEFGGGGQHSYQNAIDLMHMNGPGFGFGSSNQEDFMNMIESLYSNMHTQPFPAQGRHNQQHGTSSNNSPTMDYTEVNEEDENKFYTMVGGQVEKAVKLFEWKLDSVRKERESVIVMIENIVKQVFDKNQQQNSRTNKQQNVIVPVGIKQYGSQASFLAVDSSDVDLAVTGLKIGGDKGSQLREMRRLFTELFGLKPQRYIDHIEIIESASVPLIKLQIDLQEIRLLNRNREEKERQEERDRQGEEYKQEPLHEITIIETSMQILHIDITFDDYSSSIQLQQQQHNSHQFVENPQSGLQVNNNNQRQGQFATNANVFQPQPPAHLISSASLAISSVYKIKELQQKYKDLRNIVLIVKKLLQKHDLNKSYHGGLNSYSIVLMTSTFLENEGINKVNSLGCNLEQFFNFFGNFFDSHKQGMDGTQFFDLGTQEQNSPDSLYVVDIQNKSNNTARSAFRFSQIQDLFSRSYSLMEADRQAFLKNPSGVIDVISQLIM